MHSRRAFLRRMLGAGIGLSAARAGQHLYLGRALQPPPDTLIVDGHLDFGWNLVNYGRDYTLSALDTRFSESGQDMVRSAGRCTVGLPELLQGRVGLAFTTIFVIPARLRSDGYQRAAYTTPEEAAAWGLKMAEAINGLPARDGRFRMVRNVADLESVVQGWLPDTHLVPTPPIETPQVGLILAMEGAAPITDPGQLENWYALGLRCIGLSWGKTQYAGSNIEPDGLSEQGKTLLKGMARLGMLLDVAHLAESAFWDVQDAWTGPFVYTHGIPRHFLDTQRALSDNQIRALAARDGVMGISVYNAFYRLHRVDPAGVTLHDVVNAIDYVCQLLGDCTHVAVGSDLDGGFGQETIPAGFDTIADLQLLSHALRAKGYSEDHIALILHGNWLRRLRAALPA